MTSDQPDINLDSAYTCALGQVHGNHELLRWGRNGVYALPPISAWICGSCFGTTKGDYEDAMSCQFCGTQMERRIKR